MNKLDKIFHSAAGTLKEATANVLSAPAQLGARNRRNQVNSDVALIKKARAYDNAPNEANNGDAGMTRSLAQDARDRIKKFY